MKGVFFAYNGSEVLHDVDLVIEDRDFVCVVGPNGGGKTTLLKLMLGLLTPTRGRVRMYGRPPDEARPRMGYMPQYTSLDLQFPVTVMEVVLMGRLRAGWPPGFYTRADRDKSAHALDQVGLYDLRRRPFSELSGGQRQRVLIARALASEPALLLLDEPMANLDVQVEITLRDLLAQLNATMTVITVTHDLGFVAEVVKRVVCVNREVTTHPTHELTGERITNLYGGAMRLVRHDHRCAEKGHEWQSF